MVVYARVGSIGNRTRMRSEPMRFLVQTDSLFSLSLFALYTFYARVGSIGNRTRMRSEPMRFLVQTDSLFSLSLFALYTFYSA